MASSEGTLHLGAPEVGCETPKPLPVLGGARHRRFVRIWMQGANRHFVRRRRHLCRRRSGRVLCLCRDRGRILVPSHASSPARCRPSERRFRRRLHQSSEHGRRKLLGAARRMPGHRCGSLLQRARRSNLKSARRRMCGGGKALPRPLRGRQWIRQREGVHVGSVYGPLPHGKHTALDRLDGMPRAHVVSHVLGPERRSRVSP